MTAEKSGLSTPESEDVAQPEATISANRNTVVRVMACVTRSTVPEPTSEGSPEPLDSPNVRCEELQLDPPLRPHSRLEGMLDGSDLAHGVRQINQPLGRTPAGHDDVLVPRPVAKRLEDRW